MSEFYSLLLKFDPAGLHDAAKGWRALAHAVEDSGSRHRRQVNGLLRNSWKGDAASAGFGTMEHTEEILDIVKVEAEAAALTLDTVADRMYQAQTNLTNAVHRAQDWGLKVSPDGIVDMPAEEPAERHDPDAQEVRRNLAGLKGQAQERINAALKAAQEADRQGSSALDELDANILTSPKPFGATAETARDAAAVIRQLGLSSDPSIPDGKDPNRSADWWKSLTPDQQRSYLALHPTEIGRMDGLPSAVRDQANRLVLEQKLDALNEGHPKDFGITYDEYNERVRALETIKSKLDETDGNPDEHKLFLLGIDPDKHNGRAIVSTGNPDTADHTAVFVPGTGTVLAGVPGQIDHIKGLQAATEQQAQGQKVAVVSWLGYETPEWGNGSVGTTSRGDDGAEDMRRFAGGVRVAQSDDLKGHHLTFVGHSYGSYALGAAARDGGGLHADDIIALGSPGMGVDNASKLNIDPKHVWIGSAHDDFTKSLGGLTLGQGPHLDGWGGQNIKIDTDGHDGYWNPGSESMTNQARIIAGRQPSTVSKEGWDGIAPHP
ncbi:alpha/beta hydrolase [Kitasatospora sp. NBC_00240]|uniref:alpha/beta hydrolase n=1 Tax=Kitasatospora sp. NBC_00240 TaxID=2903567 RepID=UPI0022536534|nr:alpha/beta hydrolase [Kitasatospora sp. NBC_00240]MCX5210717.1 alpha/beta hydrolase [Kitasatospora sp. NBC_00240]